jgi:predicted amidohydrolase
VRCHLIAVQADMRLDHYRSAEAFAAKVLELTHLAVDGLDDAPRVIAFPETIGLPLLFALDRSESAAMAGSAAAALLARARADWRGALAAAWRGRSVGLGALYLAQAPAAHRAYVDAFAAAARTARATVVAGSIFLPLVEREAARGLHVSDGRVRNVAYTLAPSGRILGRTAKIHLTPGAERRAGLAAATLGAASPLHSEVGAIGVAICLDAFYPSVVERHDAAGAWLLVQPSANHADWERRWPQDPALSEGEAWLRYGLREQIQRRTNLRYGLNPMLVGEVLDLRPRGRSSVVADVRHRPDAELEGWPGLLAIAESSDREEIVRVAVELPPTAETGAVMHSIT